MVKRNHPNSFIKKPPSNPEIGSAFSTSFYWREHGQLEAMDNEIGRVLLGSGLATYKSDGSLNYDPKRTNTMVVIVGDNGTYAPSVKLPFDPILCKGTTYQTGVWVPLIVAGLSRP